MPSERSRAARTLAQNGLVALLHELGDFEPPNYILAKATALHVRSKEKDYL